MFALLKILIKKGVKGLFTKELKKIKYILKFIASNYLRKKLSNKIN